MVLYLPTYVRPPNFTPLQYGLLSVAQPVDDLDPHWQLGVQYQPTPCDSALITLGQCPSVTGFGKDSSSDGLPARGAQPFTLYASTPCSPVGFWATAEAEATAAFLAGEARALERAFWSGVVDTPSGELVYPHLAADTAVFDGTGFVNLQQVATIVVTGVDIVEGLGALEGALADCYGGVGAIHAPREALAHFAANYLVRPVGQQLQTFGGIPIAFGAGYDGSGPDGSAAPAGSAWIYATGAISMRRNPSITITSDREAALDRSVNTLQLIAERTYVIGWDCCLLAVQVSLGGVVSGSPNSAT